MKVYRLEHTEYGTGPYNSHDAPKTVWWPLAQARESLMGRKHRDYHPHPQEDGIEDFTEEHFFGFESVDAMYAWFDETFIEEIRDYGFEIFEFEIDPEHVLIGGTQVAFLKHEATVQVQQEAA